MLFKFRLKTCEHPKCSQETFSVIKYLSTFVKYNSDVAACYRLRTLTYTNTLSALLHGCLKDRIKNSSADSDVRLGN